MKLNEHFFSKRKEVKELDVNFDLNKTLYIDKLTGKINEIFKILTGNFSYIHFIQKTSKILFYSFNFLDDPKNKIINNTAVNLYIWCLLFNRPQIAKIILAKLEVSIYFLI